VAVEKKRKKSKIRGFLGEILKNGVVGLQLGLIGFVFHRACKVVHFHNPLF